MKCVHWFEFILKSHVIHQKIETKMCWCVCVFVFTYISNNCSLQHTRNGAVFQSQVYHQHTEWNIQQHITLTLIMSKTHNYHKSMHQVQNNHHSWTTGNINYYKTLERGNIYNELWRINNAFFELSICCYCFYSYIHPLCRGLNNDVRRLHYHIRCSHIITWLL